MARRMLLITFTLASLLCAGNVFAQTDTTTDVAVNLVPEHPGPYQSVSLSLQSYSLTTAAADVRWTIDGKPSIGGIGQDHISLTTKGVGVPTTVMIIVTPVGATPITKTVTITPMSVDLLWQATDSIVPPLYRGKALPTSESGMRFVAIPNIRSGGSGLAPSGAFIYNWQENFDNHQANSGYGKDFFNTKMDYLKSIERVGVDVVTRDGQTVTTAESSVAPHKPMLLWYAASPISGPDFGNSLGNSYPVSGSDVSILAEPYFFSPGNPASPQLGYTWLLNGRPATPSNIPNVLFLHRDTDAAGDANVALSISNPAKLFQDISANLTLHLK